MEQFRSSEKIVVTCRLCQQVSFSTEDALIHLKTCHQEELEAVHGSFKAEGDEFVCQSCGRSEKEEHKMLEHSCSGQRSYSTLVELEKSAILTKAAAAVEKTARMKMSAGIERKVFKCTLCEHKSATNSSLKMHYCTNHYKTKLMDQFGKCDRCPFCNIKLSKDIYAQLYHIGVHHNRLQNYMSTEQQDTMKDVGALQVGEEVQDDTPQREAKLIGQKEINLKSVHESKARDECRCFMCGFTTKFKVSMYSHISFSHFKDEILEAFKDHERCPFCEAVFISDKLKVIHIGSGHDCVENFIAKEELEKMASLRTTKKEKSKATLDNLIYKQPEETSYKSKIRKLKKQGNKELQKSNKIKTSEGVSFDKNSTKSGNYKGNKILDSVKIVTPTTVHKDVIPTTLPYLAKDSATQDSATQNTVSQNTGIQNTVTQNTGTQETVTQDPVTIRCCSLCSYKSSQRNRMYIHYGVSHFKDKIQTLLRPDFTCYLCEQRLEREKSLIFHLAVDHSIVEQYLDKQYHIPAEKDKNIEFLIKLTSDRSCDSENQMVLGPDTHQMGSDEQEGNNQKVEAPEEKELVKGKETSSERHIGLENGTADLSPLNMSTEVEASVANTEPTKVPGRNILYCFKCNYTSCRRNNLYSHYSLKHFKAGISSLIKSKTKCPICKKVFPNETKNIVHMGNTHSIVDQFLSKKHQIPESLKKKKEIPARMKEALEVQKQDAVADSTIDKPKKIEMARNSVQEQTANLPNSDKVAKLSTAMATDGDCVNNYCYMCDFAGSKAELSEHYNITHFNKYGKRGKCPACEFTVEGFRKKKRKLVQHLVNEHSNKNESQAENQSEAVEEVARTKVEKNINKTDEELLDNDPVNAVLDSNARNTGAVSGQKAANCSICSFRTKFRSNLYKHYAITHFKQEIISKFGNIRICPYTLCMKPLPVNEIDLVAHIGSAHSYVETFLEEKYHLKKTLSGKSVPTSEFIIENEAMEVYIDRDIDENIDEDASTAEVKEILKTEEEEEEGDCDNELNYFAEIDIEDNMALQSIPKDEGIKEEPQNYSENNILQNCITLEAVSEETSDSDLDDDETTRIAANDIVSAEKRKLDSQISNPQSEEESGDEEITNVEQFLGMFASDLTICTINKSPNNINSPSPKKDKVSKSQSKIRSQKDLSPIFLQKRQKLEELPILPQTTEPQKTKKDNPNIQTSASEIDLGRKKSQTQVPQVHNGSKILETFKTSSPTLPLIDSPIINKNSSNTFTSTTADLHEPKTKSTNNDFFTEETFDGQLCVDPGVKGLEENIEKPGSKALNINKVNTESPLITLANLISPNPIMSDIGKIEQANTDIDKLVNNGPPDSDLINSDKENTTQDSRKVVSVDFDKTKDHLENINTGGDNMEKVNTGVVNIEKVNTEKVNTVFVNIEKVNKSMDNIEKVSKGMDNIEKANKSVDNMEKVNTSVFNRENVNKGLDNIEKVNKGIDNIEKVNKGMANIEKVNKDMDTMEKVNTGVVNMENVNKSLDNLEEVITAVDNIKDVDVNDSMEEVNNDLDNIKDVDVNDSMEEVNNDVDNMGDVLKMHDYVKSEHLIKMEYPVKINPVRKEPDIRELCFIESDSESE